MKQISLFVSILICIGLLFIGCGKKGDPIVPVIPRPLPVQGLSANVDSEGITLSWTPPTVYDTEKPLELNDIESFVIHRKTEAPMTKGWDFATTNEGWSAVGKTEPIKHHKGVLRTTSPQTKLFVHSQDQLGITAEQNRYLRLKLWTKNARQGYIGFITNEDTNWDIDANLEFYPAVYTSYLRYQQAFANVKLKAFSIPVSTSNTAQEYIIDMGTVPTWKGTVKQIGILLRNEQPDLVKAELGLDRVEFVTTLTEQASPYHIPPWLFLEDAEGWSAAQAEQILFGAYKGVLYAQGAEPLLLLSAPGQTLEVTPSLQVQIRMQVTAGQIAYLWLRRDEDDPIPDIHSLTEFSAPANVQGASSSQLIPFPLPQTTGVHINTLNIGEFLVAADRLAIEKSDAETMLRTTTPSGEKAEAEEEKTTSAPIVQVGLIFPRLEIPGKRQVLIDFLDIFSSESALRNVERQVIPRWSQPTLPTPAEVERQLQARQKAQDPEFFIPYAQLPAEKKFPPGTSVKLAEVSPKHPEPAILKAGTFYLKDTGEFIGADDEETPAPLDYEARYTYQVDIITDNNQTSEQSSTVTVDFFKIPQNPSRLQATPGDETITLDWKRPVYTIDGHKIRHLSGYSIFRSLQGREFPTIPLTTVPANALSFTDKNLTNGIRYYYALQSIASTVSEVRNPKLSEAVEAIPVDNIAPQAPTDLVGVYLGEVVKLYWDQKHPKDFGGFHVYRSEQADGQYSRVTGLPVSTAFYEDADIEPQTRYYYQVTAIDDESPPNESKRSEMAVVDTFPLD